MKKIRFVAYDKRTETIEPSPTPAMRHLPEWYKKTPKYESVVGGTQSVIDFVKHRQGELGYHMTMKMCQPFLDAMGAGYMITLPATVIVTQVKDSEGISRPRLDWNTSFDLADLQNPLVASHMPTPQGYSKDLFRWLNNWKIETPAGYSVIYMHPVSRHELPFHTLTGFVDTDKQPNPVVLPFVIREGFEGVIEMGTPIAQVIPIKRDAWLSSMALESPNFGMDQVKQTFDRAYKRLWWSKKIYR